MTRRRPRDPSRASAVGVAVGMAAALVLGGAASGCSSDGGGATAPSSLTLPPIAPTSATSTTAARPGPGVTPPTNPPADGAPVVLTLAAEPTMTACPEGTTPVEVTYTVAEAPPVRVFTVFLDGDRAGAADEPVPIPIAPIPCDGGVHTVQLIATGTDGASSTRAVAFRAPITP